MNILFAGGGSGGHLFPGIAVAEELRDARPSCRAIFIGSDRKIERQILGGSTFEHVPLSATPSSAILRSPISSFLQNWRAYRDAKAILRVTSPRAVIGLGGFASVPIVLAARRRQIPIILLEQNAVIGRANRFLLPFASRLCLTYEQTPIPARYEKKSVATGNPVRRQVSRSEFDRPNAKTLLILGGSQGAMAVNDAVLRAVLPLQNELSGWRIVHQTGDQQFQEVQKAYRTRSIDAEVAPFFAEMKRLYAASNLVISRAGGTTLSELALNRLPAILIPFPRSIGDHQQKNAEHFQQAGAARILPQDRHANETARGLSELLKPLLADPALLEPMKQGMQNCAKPHAAREVAELILELTGESAFRSTLTEPPHLKSA